MGFLVITTIGEERYWIFKDVAGKAGVFTDEETAALVALMGAYKVFKLTATLHRSYHEVQAVDLAAEREIGSVLGHITMDTIAGKLGVSLAAIPQGNMLNYNNCI